MRLRQLQSRLCPAVKYGLVLSIVVGGVASLSAATTDDTSLLPPKPKWLTEASLTIKESYDDNIFLTDYELTHVASPIAGSAAASAKKASWVTTLSPKVVFDFAPLLSPDPKGLVRSLTLGYLPEFARYHDATTESYSAQRVSTGLKIKSGDVTLTADNLFSYIDGSAYGPSYNGKLNNAFVSSVVRDRREQVQDKANAALQYDQECWFIRGVGMVQNFNMLVKADANANYVNYVDRYDRNFGGDLGYKVTTNFALTFGYRAGEQHQDQVIGSALSASSEYQRLLLGMEGKPTKWLTVKLQAGPDFRHYEDRMAVKDANPVTFYADGSLEAKVSAKDTVGLKYKQGRSVSSTGKSATEESALELNYAHKLTDQMTALLGGRVARADYRASMAQTRDDCEYTVNAGLRYAFTPNLSAELGYMAEMGRDVTTDYKDTRTFDRNVTSLSVTIKY
ncbi:MAG: outer membrane beta-barrel protein [bacterium]